MHQILGALLVCLPLLTQAQQPSRPDTLATRVQVRGADCALFPAASRWPLTYPPPARRFTPSVAQARAAERALARGSLRALSPQPLSSQDARYADSITYKLKRYHRQYFGYYNQQGQPCLYLNCLAEVAFDACEVAELVAGGTVKPPPPGYIPHWLRAAQLMADAGDSHWWISFNLTTGQLFAYSHDLTVGGG